MMRLYSALHLLAGVFDSQFKERAVAGVVKSNSAYLVFKRPLDDKIIQKAFEQANEDVRKGLKIETYEDEKRKGFRWCRIGNYPPILAEVSMSKILKRLERLYLKKKLLKLGSKRLLWKWNKGLILFLPP